MKTIKDVIIHSTALTEKLRVENPGLLSVSFEFTDFPLEEVEAYAKENREEVRFHPAQSRFGFVVVPRLSYAYIHIRSVEVKAKLVYEPTETQPV